MEVKREFTTLFDYDLWANLKWFPFCEEEPLRRIMEHILRAQIIWLERSGGKNSFTAGTPWDLIEEINMAWKEHILSSDLEQTIHYQNSLGQKFAQPRRDVARHVINHGTYHRGQIRGMAEMMGVEDFPDTDYIFYLREPRG